MLLPAVGAFGRSLESAPALSRLHPQFSIGLYYCVTANQREGGGGHAQLPGVGKGVIIMSGLPRRSPAFAGPACRQGIPAGLPCADKRLVAVNGIAAAHSPSVGGADVEVFPDRALPFARSANVSVAE